MQIIKIRTEKINRQYISIFVVLSLPINVGYAGRIYNTNNSKIRSSIAKLELQITHINKNDVNFLSIMV